MKRCLVMMLIIVLVNSHPLSKSNLSENQHNSVQSLDEDWISQGEFISTELTSWQNASIGMPEGFISPSFTNETPESGWSFNEEFDSWDDGVPSGWRCSGNYYRNGSGVILGFDASAPKHSTAWCVSEFGKNHLYNLTDDGWTTNNLGISILEGRNREFRGTFVKLTVNQSRAYFSFVMDDNDTVYPVVNDKFGDDMRGLGCGNQSAMPDAGLNAPQMAIRAYINHDKQEAILYQDGILRCRYQISQVKVDEQQNESRITSMGGGNDSGWARYDYSRLNGGMHTFHSGGKWISPMINSNAHEWKSFTFKHWNAGIGDLEMLNEAVDIRVLDANNGSILLDESYVDYSEGLVNLSSLSPWDTIQIEIVWHRGMYDLFALGEFNTSFGEKRDSLIDIEVVSEVFEGDVFTVDVTWDEELSTSEIENHTITWTMDESFSARGNLEFLAPKNSGEYVISAKAVYWDGSEYIIAGQDSTILKVTNRPPTVQLVLDRVQFTEGEFLEYEWYASDDSWDELSHYVMVDNVLIHTIGDKVYLERAGDHIFTLVVTDDDGEQASVSMVFNVVNLEPSANLECNDEKIEVNETISCAIVYNEGVFNTYDILASSWYVNGVFYDMGEEVTLSWSEPGEKTIFVETRDDDGSSINSETKIVVDEVQQDSLERKESNATLQIAGAITILLVIFLGIQMVRNQNKDS